MSARLDGLYLRRAVVYGADDHEVILTIAARMGWACPKPVSVGNSITSCRLWWHHEGECLVEDGDDQ